MSKIGEIYTDGSESDKKAFRYTFEHFTFLYFDRVFHVSYLLCNFLFQILPHDFSAKITELCLIESRVDLMNPPRAIPSFDSEGKSGAVVAWTQEE